MYAIHVPRYRNLQYHKPLPVQCDFYDETQPGSVGNSHLFISIPMSLKLESTVEAINAHGTKYRNTPTLAVVTLLY